MKLTTLREHYRSDGSSWVAKRSFKSWKEIEDFGYRPHRNMNKVYRCKVCNHLHIGRTKEGL